MANFIRACLGSLQKPKIVGRIRSKYTCTYRSFSLAFRFSPRDLRHALKRWGFGIKDLELVKVNILAKYGSGVFGMCLL